MAPKYKNSRIFKNTPNYSYFGISGGIQSSLVPSLGHLYPE